MTESPYIVTGNVLINEGASLTIEPGVIVKFESGYSLQINGDLIARGTDSQMITFTSNQPSPAPGDWGYILFSDTSTDAAFDVDGNYISGSILEYCTVEYAGGSSVSNNGTVRADNAHPYINHCTIQNNTASGIYAWNLSGVLKITNNNISYNSASSDGGGIYASGGTIKISNNIISNNNASNRGGGIYISYGNATIYSNTISNNTSNNWGAGIGTHTSEIIIRNNHIVHNSSSNNRSGVETTRGNVTIENNNISMNNGSGILTASNATISNNIVYNNISGSNGGGISVRGGTWSGCSGGYPVICTYFNIWEIKIFMQGLLI